MCTCIEATHDILICTRLPTQCAYALRAHCHDETEGSLSTISDTEAKASNIVGSSGDDKMVDRGLSK